MDTDRKAHWERIYQSRQSDQLSWYQAWPERSLDLIAQVVVGPDSAIIDIGGGDSRLVDALLGRRYTAVTVLDISASALDRAKARLGAQAEYVSWIEGDVTRVDLPEAAFDVWHDRAAFHFLASAEDRRRYVAAARRAVRPNGGLIIRAFAEDGPSRCSGLAVVRYTAAALAAEFAPEFKLSASGRDIHRTPSGIEQAFTWVILRQRR